MTGQQGRKAPKAREAQVLHSEWISPHIVRLVLGGPGMAGLEVGVWTDHYIKLLFAPDGVRYPEPFDIDRVRTEFPRAQWPAMRSYTVRGWNPDSLEMTVDFVVHGDEGLGGPWAARVQPGEKVHFLGPGGGYAPDPAADWHLFAGDESALPAIATSLERVAPGTEVHAFIELSDPEDRQKIAAPDGVGITWLPRAGRPIGEAVVAAVRALDFPPGEIHAFVHGEAGFVKELRRHLRLERGVPREQLHCSGYWRQGQSDEAWRAAKSDWKAQVEREQENAQENAA